MSKVISIFSIFAIFGLAQSGVIIKSCPEVEPFENFDFDQYMGTWYEQARYDNHFEGDGVCVREILEKISDGKAKFSQIMTLPRSNQIISQNGTLVQQNNHGENTGALKIIYDVNPRGSDYIVLDTDYGRFAIVWSCAQTNYGRLEFAWVLTRDQQPTDELLELLQDKLENTPIDPEKLSSNCRYWRSVYWGLI